MKKKIFVFALAAVMLFLLCGCDALDELRETRAEFDGENIIYQGVTYVKLPVCPALNPDADYDNAVYVVEPDVPLLLISTHCQEQLYQSEDGNFLVYDYKETVYCREDMHAKVSKSIREGWEYTKVYYHYYEYSDDWDTQVQKYMLTQEQIDALELLTTNVEPQKLDEGMQLQSDWRVSLYECSEDELFQRYSAQIAAVGSIYYLLIDDHQLNELAFKVPEGMVSIFDDITEAYRNAFADEEIDRYA